MKDDLNSRGNWDVHERNEGPSYGERTHPPLDSWERERIGERLQYIARRRYKFTDEVAYDLAQGALEHYVEQRVRYTEEDDATTVLVRLLRGRCREHIRRQICLTAQGNAIREAMPEADVATALASGALDDLASRDARKLILEAIAELRPKAKEALQFLRNGATRLDMLEVIESLGLNKQREASNLHAYRSEFRQILARCGIRL